MRVGYGDYHDGRRGELFRSCLSNTRCLQQLRHTHIFMEHRRHRLDQCVAASSTLAQAIHHMAHTWIRKAAAANQTPSLGHSCGPFDGTGNHQIEFVHRDALVPVNGSINPHNIRIGTTWLVDWYLAGWYPQSFEYCNIRVDGQLPDTPHLWTS